MSSDAPSLSSQAANSGLYPSQSFGKREKQLLESVKNFVDSKIGSANVIVTYTDILTAGLDTPFDTGVEIPANSYVYKSGIYFTEKFVADGDNTSYFQAGIGSSAEAIQDANSGLVINGLDPANPIGGFDSFSVPDAGNITVQWDSGTSSDTTLTAGEMHILVLYITVA